MFTRSILRRGVVVAANIRKAVPLASSVSSWDEKWNFARCSFATNSVHDPAAGSLDGSGKKLSELTTQELQEALDYRGRFHKDCLDRLSLEKRLADELLKQHNEERAMKETRQDLGDAEVDNFDMSAMSATLDFIMHIPWLPFAVSMDGDNNTILILIPPWEVDRVRADFERCGGIQDPSVVKRERQCLVDGLAHSKTTQPYDPRNAAKLATAVLLLQLHGDNDDIHELDRDVLLDMATVSRHSHVITCLPQVPKKWTLDDELLIDKTAEMKEHVASCIDCARSVAGEGEAIQDLDKYRKH